MRNKLQQRTNSGFTIVEVLIVLAIAGLILLVVLLAVPALQRNSRNTSVKNDASSLAGGINEFAGNNNGAVPTKGTFAADGFQLKNATITTGATAKLQGATKVNGTNSGDTTFATKTEPAAASVEAGALYVDAGESCRKAAGAAGAPAASSRAFAIYYWTEAPNVTAGADTTTGIINGNGLKGQCLDN